MRDPETLWQDYAAHTIVDAGLGFALDTSRMDLTEAALSALAPRLARAQEEMAQLEAGAIANPDEKRMVGHYWLRDSARAPTAELRAQIDEALAAVQRFAADVHAGRVTGETGKPFSQLLVIGIGGSALGPQLAADALGSSADRLAPYFFDNTDPDGFDRVLHALTQRDGLARTLCVVISKSGGTAETRNGMLEAQAAYRAQGLNPARAMVAVTGAGSALDVTAAQQGFLARFPMWDWVGGRTSELSAVGLLPAALQGIDVTAMLDGARAMDALTRTTGVAHNPALRLAAAWHVATDGRGNKDMVVLPYKDRLVLFSKYLQQLVMESLGKALDLDGNVVHQGLAVYGNKGSTDQHAYVQQLRDGIANFFVTFIAVKQSRSGPSLDVEPGVTAGDFLNGFWLGTRRALYEGGRQSITVSIDALTPRTLGALIALYERAVGFYASLVRVNAYHQPGVEAGKKAAQSVITLQAKVVDALRSAPKEGATVAQVAAAAGASTDVETVFHVLEHLHHNGRAAKSVSARWQDARYSSGK